MTVPSSLVVMVPSPSLKQLTKRPLNNEPKNINSKTSVFTNHLNNTLFNKIFKHLVEQRKGLLELSNLLLGQLISHWKLWAAVVGTESFWEATNRATIWCSNKMLKRWPLTWLKYEFITLPRPNRCDNLFRKRYLFLQSFSRSPTVFTWLPKQTEKLPSSLELPARQVFLYYS